MIKPQGYKIVFDNNGIKGYSLEGEVISTFNFDTCGLLVLTSCVVANQRDTTERVKVLYECTRLAHYVNNGVKKLHGAWYITDIDSTLMRIK